jgi:hypothetical protein
MDKDFVSQNDLEELHAKVRKDSNGLLVAYLSFLLSGLLNTFQVVAATLTKCSFDACAAKFACGMGNEIDLVLPQFG